MGDYTHYVPTYPISVTTRFKGVHAEQLLSGADLQAHDAIDAADSAFISTFEHGNVKTQPKVGIGGKSGVGKLRQPGLCISFARLKVEISFSGCVRRKP